MDTLILFALLACVIIGFLFGAIAGMVVAYDRLDVPDLTVDEEKAPEDPEDDW